MKKIVEKAKLKLLNRLNIDPTEGIKADDLAEFKDNWLYKQEEKLLNTGEYVLDNDYRIVKKRSISADDELLVHPTLSADWRKIDAGDPDAINDYQEALKEYKRKLAARGNK